MNTQRFQGLIAVLVVVTILGVRMVLSAGQAGADTTRPAPHAAQAPDGFGGEYSGRINLTDVVTGHFNDALATVTPEPSPTRPPGTLTPAPPLARYGGKVEVELDLVLHLETTGCQAPATVCGHVVLNRTLGFHTLAYPQMAVIQATPVGVTPQPGQPLPGAQSVAIGPRVSGTFDGTTLRLESEVFTQVQAAARTIPTPPVGPPSAAFRSPEQKVERQFQLVGSVGSDGKTLVGEYRETMTRLVDGLRGQPATAIGQVSLSQPVFISTPIPTLTPRSTSTPTATTAASLTPTATAPVVATTTPTTTATPEPTHTATVAATTLPTNTSTPEPTGTPTEAATVSPTTTATPTATAIVSPTNTATPTAIDTVSPTTTATPTATARPGEGGYRLFLAHVARNVDRP